MQLKVFFLIGLTSACIQSSYGFENTFRRYISGHDVLRVIEHTFPGDPNLGNCRIEGAKLDLVGFSKPQTGSSSSKKPGPLFLDWYGGCLKDRINNSMYGLYQDRYFPPKIFPMQSASAYSAQQYYNTQVQVPYAYNNSLPYYAGEPWNKIDAPTRTALIRYWIHLVLGPGIVKDEDKLIQAYDDKVLKNPRELTNQDAAKNILYSLAMRDEFLSY